MERRLMRLGFLKQNIFLSFPPEESGLPMGLAYLHQRLWDNFYTRKGRLWDNFYKRKGRRYNIISALHRLPLLISLTSLHTISVPSTSSQALSATHFSHLTASCSSITCIPPQVEGHACACLCPPLPVAWSMMGVSLLGFKAGPRCGYSRLASSTSAQFEGNVDEGSKFAGKTFEFKDMMGWHARESLKFLLSWEDKH